MEMLYKLDGHNPVPCKDVLEWAAWFETADRQVAYTELSPLVHVSTIFFGVDVRPSFLPAATPRVFETAVFTPDGVDITERYSTWDEAVEGHRLTLLELLAAATEISLTRP